MHNKLIKRYFSCLLFFVMALAIIPFSLVHATDSSRPIGGWRYSPADQANFSQTVNYPATHTNSGGHTLNSLIMGDIARTPKLPSKKSDDASSKSSNSHTEKPASMIINGANMPLSVDESGHYERPYAFGAGSNSIEVKNSREERVLRRQFHEANAGKTPAKIRIILAWDSDHTDVDLHVVTPNGEHAWYGQRTIPSGGSIDIDATDGFGPEIFATPNAIHGEYQVYANYFGGDNQDIITRCNISIITNENSPNEKQQSFIVPLRKVGELMLVKRFIY